MIIFGGLSLLDILGFSCTKANFPKVYVLFSSFRGTPLVFKKYDILEFIDKAKGFIYCRLEIVQPY